MLFNPPIGFAPDYGIFFMENNCRRSFFHARTRKAGLTGMKINETLVKLEKKCTSTN